MIKNRSIDIDTSGLRVNEPGLDNDGKPHKLKKQQHLIVLVLNVFEFVSAEVAYVDLFAYVD